MKIKNVLVTTEVVYVVEGKRFNTAAEADQCAFAMSIALAFDDEFPRTMAVDWIDVAEFVVKNFDVRPMGDDMGSKRADIVSRMVDLSDEDRALLHGRG